VGTINCGAALPTILSTRCGQYLPTQGHTLVGDIGRRIRLYEVVPDVVCRKNVVNLVKISGAKIQVNQNALSVSNKGKMMKMTGMHHQQHQNQNETIVRMEG
jgi:hypothetical protein